MTAGNDTFAKFSAYVKNTQPEKHRGKLLSMLLWQVHSLKMLFCLFQTTSVCVCVLLALEKNLDKALAKLDEYLLSTLPNEDYAGESKRKYLDGDELTLADCNLLPKLHVIKVSLPLQTQTYFVHEKAVVLYFLFL